MRLRRQQLDFAQAAMRYILLLIVLGAVWGGAVFIFTIDGSLYWITFAPIPFIAAWLTPRLRFGNYL